MDTIGSDGMTTQKKSSGLGALLLVAALLAGAGYGGSLVGQSAGAAKGEVAACNKLTSSIIGPVFGAPQGAITCIRENGKTLMKLEGTNNGTVKIDLDGNQVK